MNIINTSDGFNKSYFTCTIQRILEIVPNGTYTPCIIPSNLGR